jgi:hypothetical protein
MLRLLLIVLVLGTPAAMGADLTRAYLNAYNDPCAFGSAHVKLLRAHNVLLVPGYLGDLYPQYFADQLQWLATLGAISSGERVEINAAAIAAAIRDSAKPVILITHSKGSVDALEALLTEPGLRARVRGWISLQGAFFGSPVADKLLDGSLVNPLIAGVALALFGGTRESAQGLTTSASRQFYQARVAAIATLLREVPAVAFASAVDRAPGAEPVTSLEIPHELMARDGIRSDGLIPLEAAVLPGMDFVRVSGIDHIAPVMPARLRLDRVRMTKALLLALPTPFRALFRDLPRDARCAAR